MRRIPRTFWGGLLLGGMVGFILGVAALTVLLEVLGRLATARTQSRLRELSAVSSQALPAPDLTAFLKPGRAIDFGCVVTRLDGSRFDLGSIRGKVAVINIWASWCKPCVIEMPSFVKLYRRFEHDPRVAFLFLSRDKREDLISFLSHASFTGLPIYLIGEDSQVFREGTIVPVTGIVSAEGQLVALHLGAADWSSPEVARFISARLLGATTKAGPG
jgi:thiol-disulfide isomerase/thioredoxin